MKIHCLFVIRIYRIAFNNKLKMTFTTPVIIIKFNCFLPAIVAEFFTIHARSLYVLYPLEMLTCHFHAIPIVTVHSLHCNRQTLSAPKTLNSFYTAVF